MMNPISMNAISIRPMIHEDIMPALSIFEKITRGKSRLEYKDLENSDLGGALDLSLIAQYGEKVIGFILARLVYAGVPLNLSGHIQSVADDPDYRRQRIAARLIEAVLDRCDNKGAVEVRTTLSEREWELGNFFENLGFDRTKYITYLKIFKAI